MKKGEKGAKKPLFRPGKKIPNTLLHGPTGWLDAYYKMHFSNGVDTIVASEHFFNVA
jgi:hypothetical protein